LPTCRDVAAAAVVDDVKVAVQAAAEAAKDKENEGQVVSVAGGKPSGKPRLRAIFLNSSPMVSKYLASTVAKNDPKTLTGNKYRTDETVTWVSASNPINSCCVTATTCMSAVHAVWCCHQLWTYLLLFLSNRRVCCITSYAVALPESVATMSLVTCVFCGQHAAGDTSCHQQPLPPKKVSSTQ
jgi:hypothetical protein